MKLGQKAMEALKEEITGSLLEGDDVQLQTRPGHGNMEIYPGA